MLFRGEKSLFIVNNYAKHKLFWQNTEFYYVKAGGTYSNRWGLIFNESLYHIE
jgi:hypothetical protein